MKEVRKHVWDLLFLERLVFHFLSSGGLSNLKNQVVFPAQSFLAGVGAYKQRSEFILTDMAGGCPKRCYAGCGPRRSSHHLRCVRDSVSGLTLDRLKFNLHFKKIRGDSYLY